MLRIVHTADCHLDAPCASLDPPGCARGFAPPSVRRSRASASWRRARRARARHRRRSLRARRGRAGRPRCITRSRGSRGCARPASRSSWPAATTTRDARSSPLAQAGCTLALTHEPVTVELTDADGAPLGHVVAIGHAGASESADLRRPDAAGARPGLDRCPACTGGRGGGSARPLLPLCAGGPSIAATPTGRSDTSTSASRSARGPPPGTPAASRRTMRASPAPRARSSWRSTARAARRSSECRCAAVRRFERVRLDDVRASASPASRARRGAPWRQPGPRRRGADGDFGLPWPLTAGARAARSRGAPRVSRGARARAGGAERRAALRRAASATRSRAASGPTAPARCRTRDRGSRRVRRGAAGRARALGAGRRDTGDPEARRAYLAGLLGEIDETLAETLLAEAAP